MPIDTGFETGVDGARLSSVWSASGLAPFQNLEYDDGDYLLPKVGSKYGYFRGSTTPTWYSDVTAASPISTDNSAITYWYYVDAHKSYRYLLGSFWSGATIGTYWLRMDSAGNIAALHEQDRRHRLHQGRLRAHRHHAHRLDPGEDDTELHHRHLHLLHASRHRVAPGRP